jgi:hypothetical protein
LFLARSQKARIRTGKQGRPNAVALGLLKARIGNHEVVLWIERCTAAAAKRTGIGRRDPASAESSSKSYSFDASHSNRGDAHGNGIITPMRSWQERGLDCCYARYEYTYAGGASEEGTIPWPVCFDPVSDPFHEPPHPMPFPLPQAGYSLPPGSELPPLEKQVYDEWAASNTSH